MSSSGGQIPSSRDLTSGDRAWLQGHGYGLPPCPDTQGTWALQPPKWAKPGVSLRGWTCSVRGEASGEPRRSKSPHTHTCTFSPIVEILSLPSPPPSCLCSPPCSSSPRGVGSSEALSTCHLVLLLFVTNFKQGFSHLLKIKRRVTYIQITHL